MTGLFIKVSSWKKVDEMYRKMSGRLRFCKILATLSFSLFLTLPAAAKAAKFRLEKRFFFIGKPYDTLRALLGTSGWEPENVHGPYQDYPEVHCSLSGQCVGYWRGKNLHEIYVDVNVSQESFITEAIQSDSEYRRENAN
jgi:hypothetical protein